MGGIEMETEEDENVRRAIMPILHRLSLAVGN